MTYLALFILSFVIIIDPSHEILWCPSESVICQGYYVTFSKVPAPSTGNLPDNLCVAVNRSNGDFSSISRNCSITGEWLPCDGVCNVYSSNTMSGTIYKMATDRSKIDFDEISRYFEFDYNKIQAIDVFFLIEILSRDNLCYQYLEEFADLLNNILNLPEAVLRYVVENIHDSMMLSIIENCLKQRNFMDNSIIIRDNFVIQHMKLNYEHYFQPLILKIALDGAHVCDSDDGVPTPVDSIGYIRAIPSNESTINSFTLIMFYKYHYILTPQLTSYDNSPIIGFTLDTNNSFSYDFTYNTYWSAARCRIATKNSSFTKWETALSNLLTNETANCDFTDEITSMFFIQLPFITAEHRLVPCPIFNLTRPSGFLIFPETPRGVWAIPINRICYNSLNLPFRIKCLDNSTWGLIPDEDCSEYSILAEITSDLYHHFQHPTSYSLDFIKNVTELRESDLRIMDLYLIAEIFDYIAKFDFDVRLKIYESVDNLLKINRSVLDNSQMLLNATDKLLGVLDLMVLSGDNIELSSILAQTIPNNELSSDFIGVLIDDKRSIVKLSDENYLDVIFNSEFSVAFVSDNFKSQDRIHMALFSNDMLFNDENRDNYNVESEIIAILLPQTQDNISLKIYYKTSDNCDVIKQCSHWNYGNFENLTAKSGKWDFDIEALNLGSGIWLCEFNHTTHFGLLLPNQVPDNFVLSFVTYLGAALSIIGLTVIFLTALLFKTWRQNARNKIILNISLCVILTIILLLVSDKIERGLMCVLFGALFHYVIVANFFWALSVSFSSYRRLVSEIHFQINNVVLKYSVFSWGLPIIFVAIILIIDRDNYDKSCDNHNSICFPKKNLYIYTVFIPICVVQLINMATFIAVIVKLVKNRFSAKIKKHCDSNQTKVIVKSMILLFFMMGLSWSLGVVGVFVDDAVHFAFFTYCFCFAVVFQGFAIFVFYIWDSNSVKNLWRDKIFGKGSAKKDNNNKSSKVLTTDSSCSSK